MKIPVWSSLKWVCKGPKGIILLALFLHLWVAISVPFIQLLYIVEVSFYSDDTKQEVTAGSSLKLTQIRVSLAKL